MDTDIIIDEPINNDNTRNGQTIDRRVQGLTEKLKTQGEDTERERIARQEAETKALNLEKERDFYSSFSDSTSQYPQASEYKDQIKEKVMAGYTVEDATVSILAKEGKLTNAPAPRENIAGGSATNSLQAEGSKTTAEMDRAEKRAALIQAEQEGGSLSAILRRSN